MTAFWLWPYLLSAALCGAGWVIADGYRRKQATRCHPLRIWERIAGRNE